jgi:hypothetical protein
VGRISHKPRRALARLTSGFKPELTPVCVSAEDDAMGLPYFYALGRLYVKTRIAYVVRIGGGKPNAFDILRLESAWKH